MSLKPDEEFVKNCLLKHFGGSATAWEGEDPPDIYIMVDGKTMAVEITRLSPVSIDENGIVQNRKTEDSFGSNLCNELNSKLGENIPPEVDILLTLYVPVENARQYKKQLHQLLKETIGKGIEIGNEFEFSVSGEKVKVDVIPNRKYSQKKVLGLVVNTNSIVHIQSNAEIILSGRLLDKIEKCRNIKHQGLNGLLCLTTTGFQTMKRMLWL